METLIVMVEIATHMVKAKDIAMETVGIATDKIKAKDTVMTMETVDIITETVDTITEIVDTAMDRLKFKHKAMDTDMVTSTDLVAILIEEAIS